MLKIFLIIAALFIFIKEFWFLTSSGSQALKENMKVNVEKLPIIKDGNSSLERFFDKNNWFLTSADEKESEAYDDTTQQTGEDEVTLISKKSSKQLCRGEKCVTIKALLADALLLKEKEKIFSLHMGDVLFDTLKFTRLSDTKLFFEDNQTNKEYALQFFAYENIKDKNETKNKE